MTLAPELRDLMVNIAPLTSASKTGVPALRAVPRPTRAVAQAPDAVSREPRPGGQLHQHLPARARRVLRQQHGHDAGHRPRTSRQTKLLHYLRISNPVNPETLTNYQKRLESNRGNPYMAPGGYTHLLNGLSVFGSYLCTANPQPTIGPTIPANLAAILRDVVLHVRPGGPPCKAQAPLGTITTVNNSHSPIYNPCHEHGRLCCNQTRPTQGEIQFATDHHHRYGACRCSSPHGRLRHAALNTYTRRASRSRRKAGSTKSPRAGRLHPDPRPRTATRGNRAAPLTDIKITIYGLVSNAEALPDLQRRRDRRRRRPTASARRRRWSPRVRSTRCSEADAPQGPGTPVQPVPARLQRRPGKLWFFFTTAAQHQCCAA